MKKMTRKYKIITAGVTLSAITAASVAIPLSIQTKSKEINLFNRSFASREKLMEYVLKNTQYVDSKNNNVYWTINNGEEKIFTSHDSLKKYIYNKIEQVKIKHFNNIDEKNLSSSDGSILNRMITDIKSSLNSKEQRFYRGIKDTIYNTKKEAIDSYFQYHKVFMYDNITFRTIEDLKKYLFNNYDNLKAFDGAKGKYNISSPNGITSNFFNFSKNEDVNQARRFVEQTSNRLLGFRDTNNGFNYVDVKDIAKDSLNNNFWSNLDLNSINAIRLKANNGEGLWITDTQKSDGANFYGDYFTKTKTNEIKFITDTKQWAETKEPLDYSKLNKARNASTVGSFFNIINRLVAYSDLDIKNKEEFKKVSEIKTVFEVPRYKKMLSDLVVKYKSNNIDNIVDKLKETSTQLYEGKRFNPLYEVPLLYLQTLATAQDMNLKNKELKILKEFFAKVMDDYQESMETILPKEALVDREGKAINLKHLFGINDVSFDLNSTPESAMYKLVESTKFMEGVKTYLNATANKLNNGGAGQFYTSGIKEEKYQKMWTVLGGSVADYSKSHDKAKDLQEDLGRKLTSKQVDLFMKILTINDELMKVKEKAEAEYDWNIFKKVFNSFTDLSLKDLGAILKSNPSWANQRIGDKKSELDQIRKIYAKGNFDLNKDDLNSVEEKIKKRTLKDKYIKLFNTKISGSKKIPKGIKKIVTIDINKLNSVEGDAKRLKRFKNAKKVSGVISGAQSAISGIADVHNLVSQIQNNDAYGALKSVASLFNTAAGLMGSVPVLGAAFQVLGFALDVASEIVGKKTHQVFKFNTSEDHANKFYWDGGEKTVRFWGLWSQEDKGVKDMKIASPIKIWNGTNVDGYYYNGKFYKDVNKLRKQALIDFVKGDDAALILDGKNPSVSRGFTYKKIESDKQLNHGSKVFDTKEELAKAIVPDNLANQIAKDKSFFNNHKYFKHAEFSLVGGKVAQLSPKSMKDKLEMKKFNITELLKQIKPTLVVQIPEIIDGLPYDQGKGNLEAIIKNNNYKLPGKLVYKMSKVNTINNYKPNKYIMINLNEQIQDGKFKKFKYTSTQKAISKIKELFLKTIDVDSIYSLKSNSIKINKFSKLKTIKEYKLFKVVGTGGQTKLFKDYTDAFKWITSEEQLNLKTIISKTQGKKLMFNNKFFKDEVELINYLDTLISKQGGK